ATPSRSGPRATRPVTAAPRDKGKNKQRDKSVPPTASVPPVPGMTGTIAPTVAPKPPKEKPGKQKYETVAPPAAAAPRIAPPMTPETKHNQPLPDATKPEASIEKPKREPPADFAPKMKKEPPPANVPVNRPPARDEGKKQKKNEPATSPTP